MNQADSVTELDCKGSKGKPNLLFNFQGLSEKQLNSTETNYGGVAQLGEHLPCKQRVMGSNPIISTKWDRKRRGRID